MPTNLEIVQGMYAAFGRGDIGAILAQLDENVSWESEAPAALPYGGIMHGPGEAVKFFQGLAAEHTDIDFAMTEFFEKPDAVAAFGRYAVTVKATGKRVDTPVGHLFTFKDGKVTRYVNLVNTGAFLEANQA